MSNYNCRGQGEQDHGGGVIKTKICELEEEVRAGNLRRMWKELTGVVQGFPWKNMFLVRVQGR